MVGKIKKIFAVWAVFIAVLLVFGCQSTRVAQNEIDAYDVLTENSVLYVKIPVKENKDIFSLFCSRVGELDDKTISDLYKYFDEIFVSQREDDGSFEAVIKGKFPSSVKSFLKSKDFEKNSFEKNGRAIDFYKRVGENHFQFAFLDKNTLCMSGNVGLMLDRFVSGAPQNELVDKVKDRFSAMNSENMLFFMPQFENFFATSEALKEMMGNLDCVYGFSYLKDDGSLDSDMYIELRDKSSPYALNGLARAFKFLLALTGENISVEVEEDKDRIHLTHMSVFDF